MQVVALLTEAFDSFGGIQTFSRSLVRVLGDLNQQRAWRVHVLTLQDRSVPPEFCAFVQSSNVRLNVFGGNRLRFVAAASRAALRADRLIIGHLHFAPLAALPSTSQSVLITYGVEAWSSLAPHQALGARLCSKLVAISEYTRSRMLAANPRLGAKPFTLLPCTLDPQFEVRAPTKTRTELGLPDGPVVLIVSRLVFPDASQKGVDATIRAMRIVKGRVPAATLVVVGSGPYKTTLEQLAVTYGVADAVRFVGHVPGAVLQSYFHHCDVFALPSRVEGFGIVYLEAMAYGKACVGVADGAAPEVIEDGSSGLLAADFTDEALAEALVTLLRDRVLAERMGENGKRRLAEHFSYAGFAQRVENLLSEEGRFAD